MGFLTDLADRFGADTVATGHYARVERGDGGAVRLFRGRDYQKDQSYFLFGLAPKVLRRLEFPLGELEKTESRAEARRLGLPNADKPDSQELCFIPDGDVRAFAEREAGRTHAGRILSEDGTELGRHEGIEGFTVGQRKGLGLGGGPPRYVLKIVPESSDVVVGDVAGLRSSGLDAVDAAWPGGRPTGPFDAQVRIRYRHDPAPAEVTPTEDGFRVRFEEPQRAITPGQATVVYQGDEVIAGGFISKSAEQ
ncbi:MAG: tRNA 2-thiouridine(34) synthase MnmA [Deltaproteobacteria bacterium]|nr:MAG: tRNA 2-thiouridine(34) synthase MnmA [Deltaproteobacteria bacterium]